MGAPGGWGTLCPVELSLIIDVILTPDRQAAAEALLQARNWQQYGITTEQVLAMPAIFIGTIDEVVATMQQRRKQFGFSYYVVADQQMEEFAPVVTRLRGQ